MDAGAHLANAAASGKCELFYWRDRNQEVDFIVKRGRRLIAIEVKSGRAPTAHSGMAAFATAFNRTVACSLVAAGLV